MTITIMSAVTDSLCNDIVDFVERGGIPVWHLYAFAHGKNWKGVREEYEDAEMDTSFLDSGESLHRECFARCVSEGLA